jgi:hypothetical protein
MLVKTQDGDYVAEISTEKDILSCYPCTREVLERKIRAFNAKGGMFVSKAYYNLRKSYCPLQTSALRHLWYTEFVGNEIVQKHIDEKPSEDGKIMEVSDSVLIAYEYIFAITDSFTKKAFYSSAKFSWVDDGHKDRAVLTEGEFYPARLMLGGALAKYIQQQKFCS